MSALEKSLTLQIRARQLPLPEKEYRFAMHHVGGGEGIRKRLKAAGLKDWRFDFAWPSQMLAVEVEGGAFTAGRHTRGAGFREDCIKYHHAMMLGWTVYRCEAWLVQHGHVMDFLKRFLKPEAA
jgi:hypothetical protein